MDCNVVNATGSLSSCHECRRCTPGKVRQLSPQGSCCWTHASEQRMSASTQPAIQPAASMTKRAPARTPRPALPTPEAHSCQMAAVPPARRVQLPEQLPLPRAPPGPAWRRWPAGIGCGSNQECALNRADALQTKRATAASTVRPPSLPQPPAPLPLTLAAASITMRSRCAGVACCAARAAATAAALAALAAPGCRGGGAAKRGGGGLLPAAA